MQRAIYSLFKITLETASAFYRAIVNKETYYSKLYRRAKVRNSYTVAYVDGDTQKYGFIEYFLSLPSHTAVVITPLTPTSDYCYPEHVRTLLCRKIIPVSVHSSFSVISSVSLLYKCVCIALPGGTFIAKLPNPVHTD